MYFPVSGVETSFWLPPLFAFAAAFFCSMGGISGAFLLLPFQVSVLGYTAPSVSATNQVFNLVAIPSGVYRYIREGRMLWPLTWIIVAGTLPGVMLGAWLRVLYLPDPELFKLFVGCVLLFIGLRMSKDLPGEWRKRSSTSADPRAPKDKANAAREAIRPVVVKACTLHGLSYTFADKEYSLSPVSLFLLCFIVGIIGAIYGIGGGSIVAPFLVAVYGLPVYTVAGAVLMGTLMTSITGLFAFHWLADVYPQWQVAPDWSLGLCFGIGGFLGMYLGARCQKFFSAAFLKAIICFCILFVAMKYVAGFFF